MFVSWVSVSSSEVRRMESSQPRSKAPRISRLMSSRMAAGTFL